jgi:hypothetical protein
MLTPKLALAAVAGILLLASTAQGATYTITSSGTTAGFWRVDCALAATAPQCAGAGGAIIEVPFLSVTPSPTTSTGTIEIDLSTGNIIGGSYLADGVAGNNDISAGIDIGILFGLPNGFAFATLAINDSSQDWLAVSSVGVVGEDFLYAPGALTDPSASSVTCTPPGAVCGSATVLGIIANGGLPLAHAPDPLASLLIDFNDGSRTSFTMTVSSDTFTVNDPATCGTAANAIPCFVLGTRTVGSTVFNGVLAPEPATAWMMGTGALGLALLGRRRRA